VTDCADDPQVKIRICDARWGEIVRDLERAPTFDSSTIFSKVYSEEFGTPGGEPYGMLVIDHQVWHKLGGRERTDDIEALGALAEVASAAFCPTVLGCDPRIAGMNGFDEIDLRQDLPGALMGPEYTRWNRLRSEPDTRFLSLVVPRLLARERYAGRSLKRLGFVYDERLSAHSDSLWLNGGFALAQVAARAMRVHRWPAAIRGAWSPGEGGIVEGPVRRFLPSDRPGVVARFASENAISEEQEMALNASGLMCLRQLHLTGTVAFLNLPSLHKPPEYDSEAAQMNAKMSAMLNYIFCVCRFAHYIKVIARDWVGKYTDDKECQRLLQNWLSGYVTGNDDASAEMRIKYPLRQAAVSVTEVLGKPGTYSCDIAIRPHYQLDQIASEFRLTTEIGREVGR
jgi:type VI secretion system ImpC/EvpB family protein